MTLTPAMINNSNFGVQFAIQANSANTDVYVEYLKMTVYYNDQLHNLSMMGSAPGRKN